MRPNYPKSSLFSLCWLLLLFVAPSCVVQRLDRTPYQQTSYYTQTLKGLQEQQPATMADTLQAGWAKVNITPEVGTPMAGYGKRRGMKYNQVHDSVWVRTFAFDNGKSQTYFVALDMLIAPMEITAALEQKYAAHGLRPEQVYLTATHTHTSFGGWGKKLAGRIMAGKYKKRVVQQTTEKILQSIKLAQANLQPTRFGYGSINAASWVSNRLTGSEAARDTLLRFLKFEQASGSTAILCTFAAHPTILPSMQPILSRDYPGALVYALEQKYDFAAFSAGAVASHRAVYHHGDSFESVQETGQALAQLILAAVPAVKTAYTSRLGSSRLPLYLPEPQWRIGDNHRFAPGLFYTLFGRYPAYLSSLQLGNTIMLGMPADYSGEFMSELEQQAKEQEQHLLVTGFNGGYLGYIIPDEHYKLKKYEARAMNFYGPHSGSYLQEVLRRMIGLYRP
ncbi:neutral/alkaline non-lysosomal ceramidase N-terminal domain-containing protein [Pontibacter ruber]|uniref:Neutral ceramidase n=1 Tax=Pontibacter ruber TaxID=1343895 RepID=A0ABW5CV73_9BACT|nr:neutral/alkaline non-lysosomal ceramidase N-terminal domain-containing protein [Pontibacter ruber]